MKKIILLFLIGLISYDIHAQCIGEPGQVSWHFWKDIPYYQMDQLYADDTYPIGPDGVKILNAVSTPFNYDDQFGSVVKGFISVPESGLVTFNVTGDDQTLLLLSTDATAANLDTTAYIEYWTSREEHNKYPSQTYGPVSMNAGQYYYFELHNREGIGGDHASLYWQRPYVSDTTWQLITSPYLTDICDAICPPKGTACDDGDSSTTDDIEDGWCNCAGTTSNGTLPIGDRGVLTAYFYDDISGGNLSTLLEDPDYPSVPDRLSLHSEGLFAQWSASYDNFGVLIKGFLKVPVDGCYDFNVTGVSNTRFSISSDATPSNMIDSIETRWGTNTLEHDHTEFDGSQTMTDICMTAGNYYYFEMKQNVPSWGHRFSIFWKTPQHTDDRWHRIPEINVYDYIDPLICLPVGTACDDGDPYTSGDQIDVNCSCAGTPCEPFVNCDDPAANYVKYDYCETTDELGTRADDAWLSCDASTNPYIPIYSGFHWIHYDLGSEYELQSTRVWNYNVPGATDRGFGQVAVHYSTNGTSWSRLGIYNWSQASGNSNYSGFDGPDFDGVAARYVIFTCLDQTEDCRGIGKITFDANLCQIEGTPCNDNDMATYNDHYDDHCTCRGYTLEELDCAVDTMFIYEDDIATNEYHAISALMSNGRVMNAADINYEAGKAIVLNAGFEVSMGSSLEASINDCPSASIAMIESGKKELKARKSQINEELSIYTIDGQSIQTIRIFIPEPTSVSLDLLTQEGELITSIVHVDYKNRGDVYKRIETRKLNAGIYMVRMTTARGTIFEKLIVL